MGGTGWIEELKRGTTFAQVASTIGMTERHRRYAPCPACKRSRSDNDARPTVTVGASGAWKCHSCHAKGDAVALLWRAVSMTAAVMDFSDRHLVHTLDAVEPEAELTPEERFRRDRDAHLQHLMAVMDGEDDSPYGY